MKKIQYMLMLMIVVLLAIPTALADSPIASITSPSADEFFNAEDLATSSLISIEATVTDDTEIAEITLGLNSEELDFSDFEYLDSGELTGTIDASELADGEYTFEIVAVDIDGDEGYAEVDFVIDAGIPTITITTAEATEFHMDDVELEFTLTETYSSTLFCGLWFDTEIDGVVDIVSLDVIVLDDFDVGDVTFSYDGSLAVDEYEYYFLCVDEAENSAESDILTFSSADLESPAIYSEDIFEGQILDSSDMPFIFVFQVFDDNSFIDDFTAVFTSDSVVFEPSLIEIDSESGDLEDNDMYYIYSFEDDSVLADGLYSLVMTGSDIYGNTVVEELSFTVDTTAPVVTIVESITMDSDNYWTVDSFDEFIDFTVTDSADLLGDFECDLNMVITGFASEYTVGTVTVEASGSAEIAIDADLWDLTIALDADYPSPIDASTFDGFIACYDAAGNQEFTEDGDEFFTLEFENSGPIIEFVYPDSTTAFGTSEVQEFEVIVTDFFGDDIDSGTFTVIDASGAETELTDMTTEGDSVFVSFDPSGFSDGEYELSVTATDVTGEESTASQLFYIDTVGSEVVSISPGDGDFIVADAETFIVTVSDASSFVSTVTFYDADDHGLFTTVDYTTAGQTEFGLVIDFSGTSDGDIFSFDVVATDAAGNAGDEFTISVTVDDVDPVISSFTCSDVTVDASSTCVCLATDDNDVVTTAITGDETDTAGAMMPICTATDAAGNSVSSLEGDVIFTVSAATTTSSSGGSGGGGSGSSSRSECEDGKDNDGDGLFDLDDPGCSNSDDDSETDKVCTESWTCTAWAVCSEDGSQDRSCYDANACEFKESRGQVDVIETVAAPTDARSCTYVAEATVEVTETTTAVDTTETGNSGNLLTGAITGGFVDTAKGLAAPIGIIAAIAVVLAGSMFFRKKK
ncbi:hypothetical protein HOC96_05395 [archaeon]|nr:hypothetical protein [archaeon]